MNALTVPVLGDQAADTVTRTRRAVLLLADHPGPATITAAIGGTPRCYTGTIATYEDGLRAEVGAPDPGPEEPVRRALPGGGRVTATWLATPGQFTDGYEVRHDGLMARAGVRRGWTLLTVTLDTYGRGQLPALRLVGAASLATGRAGRAADRRAAADPAMPAGRVTT
ncbi:hypothetical protein ACFVHB_12405 [Kitasatospora sp. NPDC127111]|uniref:hypothetical protein n=1 Tax=Kitasatospora sp. NPDC127111 TaxID=3345363 RepID=UPI003627F39D